MDFDGENSGPLHWRLELHPIARLWRRKSSVHQGQQPRPPWRRRSAHGSLASAVTTRTSQLSPNHVQTCSYQGHSRSLSSLSRSISLEFHRHPYSTLGFEIILLSLSRSLSRSLVPSRADWRLHFRTSYYSTFQMLFSNWLHATARKRAQPCPPLACQTWLQERLPCIWYHINTSCPTIHTQ